MTDSLTVDEFTAIETPAIVFTDLPNSQESRKLALRGIIDELKTYIETDKNVDFHLTLLVHDKDKSSIEITETTNSSLKKRVSLNTVSVELDSRSEAAKIYDRLSSQLKINGGWIGPTNDLMLEVNIGTTLEQTTFLIKQQKDQG